MPLLLLPRSAPAGGGTYVAPTLVNRYDSAATWGNVPSAPQTITGIAVQAGDRLVVLAACENYGSGVSAYAVSDTGSNVWTNRAHVPAGGTDVGKSHAVVFTATAAATGTISVTYDNGALLKNAFVVYVFRGSDGFGGVATYQGGANAPNIALTTAQDHSTVVGILADWNATSCTPVYRTGFGTATEDKAYQGDTTNWGVRVIRHADAGTAAASTYGIASGDSGCQWYSVAIEVKGTFVGGGGGLGGPVRPASEAEAALTLARAKVRPIGTALETDASQALLRGRSRTVLPAAETDTTLTLPRAKTRTVGTPAESDTSMTLPRRKTRTVGAPLESDAAVAAARGKARTLGAPVETDAAVAFARGKRRVVGIPVETDNGVLISRPGAGTITLAVGTAVETDVSLAVARRKARLLGLGLEVDGPVVVARRKTRGVTPPVEADAAQLLQARKARALGVAAEPDVAVALPRRKTRPVLAVVETEQPQPIGRRRAYLLGRAIETDAAQPITLPVAITGDDVLWIVGQPYGWNVSTATSWEAEAPVSWRTSTPGGWAARAPYAVSADTAREVIR